MTHLCGRNWKSIELNSESKKLSRNDPGFSLSKVLILCCCFLHTKTFKNNGIMRIYLPWLSSGLVFIYVHIHIYVFIQIIKISIWFHLFYLYIEKCIQIYSIMNIHTYINTYINARMHASSWWTLDIDTDSERAFYHRI